MTKTILFYQKVEGKQDLIIRKLQVSVKARFNMETAKFIEPLCDYYKVG